MLKQIIWFIRQILALFIPAVNKSQGGLVTLVKNKVTGKPLFSQVKAYHALREGHEFDGKFGMVLIQDYDNPNTFNDWLLLWVGNNFRKVRVTGEGGKWQKGHAGWPGQWMPGYYENIFKLSRDGVTEFQFVGLPALQHFKQVTMMNMNTDKPAKSAGCHIHGRHSTSDQVNLSSLGCIVTKVGKKIRDILRFVKKSYIHERDGIKSQFSLTVALKEDFPDITGVKTL